MSAVVASRATWRSVSLALLAALDLVLLAAVSERFFFRIDLTSSRMFTPADSTLRLVSTLRDPLRVTYWISPDALAEYPEARSVEDFLRELEALSAGKVTVEIVDPAASGKEREAQALGAMPMELPRIGATEVRVTRVYAGVTLSLGASTDSIPVVIGESAPLWGFEYDFIKRARKLLDGGPKTIAILEGAGEAEFGYGFSNLAGTLALAGFDVVPLEPGIPVPSDIDAIFVLGAGSLGAVELAPVEAWLRQGGSAFFAVQPWEISVEDLSPVPVESTATMALLAAWGVRIGEGFQLDVPTLSFPSDYGSDTNLPYPHWILAKGSGLPPGHPATARLPSLLFPWPSPMDLDPVPGLAARPLAMTTRDAWRMLDRPLAHPKDAEFFHLESERTRGTSVLAVALEGILPSVLSSTDPALPSRLIVVPCTSAFRDYLLEIYDIAGLHWTPGHDPGYAFVRAAADWLAREDAAVPDRAAEGRLDSLSGSAKDSLTVVLYALAFAAIPAAILFAGIARLRLRGPVLRSRTGRDRAEGDAS